MGLVSEFDAFWDSFSLNSNLGLSAVNYLAKKYIFRVASSLQTRFSILRFSSHLGKRTPFCLVSLLPSSGLVPTFLSSLLVYAERVKVLFPK